MKHFIIYAMFISIALAGCKFSRKPTYDSILEKYRHGQFNYAKTDIDEYLKEKPEDAKGWALLGHIEISLGEDSLAVVAFRHALKIDDNTVDAWHGMGLVSMNQGYYAEALSYFDEARRIESGHAPIYNDIGCAFLFDKNFKMAVDAGLIACNMDPGNPTFAGNLSVAYHYAGNIDKRNEYYNIAEELGYDNPQELLDIFDGKTLIFGDEVTYGE